MSKLIPKPKFITFDRYGTLVQWHSALLTGVRAVLAKHVEVIGMEEAQVTETVEARRTLSMEQQQRPPYRRYKTILQSSLAEVMAGKKLSPQPSDGETLLSYLRTSRLIQKCRPCCSVFEPSFALRSSATPTTT